MLQAYARSYKNGLLLEHYEFLPKFYSNMRELVLLAQMRALETRRWMVRVTDGGISTTVDPKGFLSHNGRSKAGGLVEKVGLAEHKTFYVRYGDWIMALALLLLCVELSWRYQRRKNS